MSVSESPSPGTGNGLWRLCATVGALCWAILMGVLGTVTGRL